MRHFHYQCGNVETNLPWYPPDPAFLNSWAKEFFQIPETQDFDFWLCGAAMESRPTHDVDIIVTGEIKDINALDRVLTGALRLGFKHRQLIDIGWNHYYKKYLEKGPCNNRGICCEHFYTYGWCDVDACSQQTEDVETIVVGNEIRKNGCIITPACPHAIQMSESLWKVYFKSPSDKQIERIRKGIRYEARPLLINAEFDFRRVISWP